MSVPDQFVLSDLLKHRVQCDQGIDHGPGVSAWMHPPVHRILGWSSRPSTLRLSRHIWKLNQLRGIGSQEVYVKGTPSETDQGTIDRLPTLLNSDILNLNGESLGSVVDFVFEPGTGKIQHYLVSRTDPRIPGTSRWRLLINHIIDQQPGIISLDVNSLNDLPLVRSSVKQDLLRRSRNWREQFQEFSDKAGNRLEGWLEEPPWEEFGSRRLRDNSSYDIDPIDDWNDEYQNKKSIDDLEYVQEFQYPRRPKKSQDIDEDPWI